MILDLLKWITNFDFLRTKRKIEEENTYNQIRKENQLEYKRNVIKKKEHHFKLKIPELKLAENELDLSVNHESKKDFLEEKLIKISKSSSLTPEECYINDISVFKDLIKLNKDETIFTKDLVYLFNFLTGRSKLNEGFEFCDDLINLLNNDVSLKDSFVRLKSDGWLNDVVSKLI